ncbi:YqhG family protein [Lysinibacillus sp. KU-BSD001]|uniref:YqhG family protein n=1 Tax=Lysinibacillus sp. KU-BSD001 TaxID=3141328 RepID=UPI0036EAB1B1
MYPQQVQQYLQTFFTETGCDIVTSSPHVMTVQLTIDMDKKMMNRPFYWQYIESTNGEPNPMQVTFITDAHYMQKGLAGEIVNYGSPRLTQLFRVTKELGAFVQMFEQVERGATLTPWLCVNYKVSYKCDLAKEKLYSLGINLMTGEMEDGFHESLHTVHLTPNIPEDVYALPYIIKPLHALKRLDETIEALIHQEDHTWASDAQQRLTKELRVLDYFYEGVDNKPECYEIEKTALEERYTPRICIDIMSGGLFYLT